jgi:transposase InsO family protein
MPFRETCRMEKRIQMLSDYDTGAFSVSAVSARHGVSRDTFYFWLKRRASGDPQWFADRSHAPVSCPHKTAAAQRDQIIAMRHRFPHFGPKKIRARLLMDHAGSAWPAASTIGDILDQAGLVERVRRRRRAVAQAVIAPGTLTANSEWAIDFKGWFRTRDGTRCDPLTVTDTASRYLLAAQIVSPTFVAVQRAMCPIFAQVGLPAAIRCDNGSPFGSTGAGGLSQLAVWWLRLGIEPHYIHPASPQENGRHERMHRTLKKQTALSPANTIAEQQARFDVFREHFNSERPHEALGQELPDTHWQPSPRAMPATLPDPWYDANHEVRRVRPDGIIKWRGAQVFIGEALAGQWVGLSELDNGSHAVRFCSRDLGVLDTSSRFRRFAPPRVPLHTPDETKGE